MAVLVLLLFSGFGGGGCRINWWLIGFIHLYGLHIRTHSNMSEFISKSPSGAFLKFELSGPFRNSWEGRNCLVSLSLLLWDCCLLKQESSVSLTQVIPASWLSVTICRKGRGEPLWILETSLTYLCLGRSTSGKVAMSQMLPKGAIQIIALPQEVRIELDLKSCLNIAL